jgi:hypothetical protein
MKDARRTAANPRRLPQDATHTHTHDRFFHKMDLLHIRIVFVFVGALGQVLSRWKGIVTSPMAPEELSALVAWWPRMVASGLTMEAPILKFHSVCLFVSSSPFHSSRRPRHGQPRAARAASRRIPARPPEQLQGPSEGSQGAAAGPGVPAGRAEGRRGTESRSAVAAHDNRRCSKLSAVPHGHRTSTRESRL